MDRLPLDPEQARVVAHEGGPLLVLGGPGTGKSTTLVERWVRLAREGPGPHRVLLLVHTRERALALRDELPWRLPQRAIVEVPVHTWHALAYHLVSRYYRLLGYDAPPVLLTGPEQWAVVRELLAAEDPGPWGAYAEHRTSRAFVDEVADLCLRAGHRGASVEDLRRLTAGREDYAAVVAFVARYREHLARSARLDYAGLMGAAADLLAAHPQVRERVRRRFPHVLVDDAHELAPAQLRLLANLSTEHLVCAADPDSAFEAFRGADPRWLERFSEVAGPHGVVVLPTSHRLGPRVGEAALRLIGHGGEGPHRPKSFAGPAEASVQVRCYGTLAGEVEAAAREVRAAHLSEGIPYERMAILLAQPGTYLHPLQRCLEQLGVPFRVAGDGRPLGAEPAVRAVLDLCRLALGGPDDEVLAGVLASPLVGLEPHRVRELRREAFRRGVTLEEVVAADPSPEAEELRRLRAAVAERPDEPADLTLGRVLQASSWVRRLLDDPGRPEHAEALGALAALGRALGRFVERQRGGTMGTYLQTSAQAGFEADPWAPAPPQGTGVHLLSLHAAKGMEWDVVCVLGAAEGQIPKARRSQGLFDPWALQAGSPVDRVLEALAEERRTFYVGITRARRRLVVSCSPGPGGRANPSRFLEEAFGVVPEPAEDGPPPPLTLAEAEAALRRTLVREGATVAEKAAAACALARIPGLDARRWWWRRDWTPGAPLAPSGKLVTSYSRIGLYDNCPLQYLLQSVLGLDPTTTYQMKFGSLVHRVIERVERGELTTLEQAKEAFQVGFDWRDYPNRAFARTYWREGLRMLERWWAAERTDGETVAVEYAFDDLDLDGHTIRGRIDRVARKDGGLVLTDYKTSRSMVGQEDASRSLQLAIYYLAAKTYPQLRAHGEPVRMQLVYPGIESWSEGGRPARRIQKPAEAEEALERLRGILADAAAERFAPSPEADCRWCSMRPLCPRWPEGRETGP